MKRKWLSIIALALALCMLPMPAFATETDQDALSFAVSRASSCITKSEYIPQQGVTLSNPIPQYESVTGNLIANVYLIFDGSKHIGLVLVSTNGENRFATAYLCNYPVLETAKSAGSRVVFYQENGCFAAYVNGVLSVLENPYGVTDFSELEIEDGYIISDATTVSLRQNRSIYYSLNVDIVANWNINGGICWAAALASKINYQKGTDLDALDVYNTCVSYWSSSGMSENNRPVGNAMWHDIAANEYGISLTYLNSHISTEERIVRCLRLGYPILMDIAGKSVSNATNYDVYHEVVICGIEADAEFYEFKIMDPNLSTYQYFAFPRASLETGKNFEYTVSYATYSWWYGTYY